MRVLLERTKLAQMLVTMKDNVVWFPHNASVHGADVELEAIGFKIFAERDIGKEKLRKPLTTVRMLNARGAGMEWESCFKKLERAVMN